MGNQAMFILAGVLLLAGTVAYNLSEKTTQLGVNSEKVLARARAKEFNNASMETAMRMLADDTKLRTPYSNSVQSGSSTVTFRDTVIAGDSLIVARGTTRYAVGVDTGFAEATVIVSPKPKGFIPLTVRGGVTAFGPIDDLIGDMYIDGREHDLQNKVIPGKGVFAVSTGTSKFTNKIGAYLGGTYTVNGKKYDQAPILSVFAPIIETKSSWPKGWPTTPDAALGLAEGTLKSIAQKKVEGSQYITSLDGLPTIDVPNQVGGSFKLLPEMKGVTYIEVPSGTHWKNVAIRKNSEGLMVFHSPAGDAFFERIAMEGDDHKAMFKGLMIFDRLFHLHINVLGAVIALDPKTEKGNCPGNNGHWVNYCSEAIMKATKVEGINPQGSWRNILAVQSWLEKAEAKSKAKANNGNGNGNGKGNG